jgi:hypothetical protein
MLAGIAELVGDVALTVGVWTSIGWCLLVAVRLAHTKVQLDLPAPVQHMEPGVRREA